MRTLLCDQLETRKCNKRALRDTKLHKNQGKSRDLVMAWRGWFYIVAGCITRRGKRKGSTRACLGFEMRLWFTLLCNYDSKVTIFLRRKEWEKWGKG